MYKANLTSCPICGAEVKNDVKQEKEDEFVIRCTHCGKYAMSQEFYEDEVDKPHFTHIEKRVEAYLFTHKNEAKPVCLCNCEATVSVEYRCITMKEIDSWCDRASRQTLSQERAFRFRLLSRK